MNNCNWARKVTQYAYVISVLHNLMDARWWRDKSIEMHVSMLSVGLIK